MKTSRITIFIGIALALSLSTSSIVVGQSEKAKKEEEGSVHVPEAILASFHKAYPHAVIHDILEEVKNGKTYYEIESMDDSQRRDLLYMANGTVFEIEEAWDISALPKEVTATLKSKFPYGKLQKAERITHGNTIQFEVLLENGEDNLEILLDSKGAIVSQAAVDDHDEESDAGENDEADED
ncbi:MAG TPA: hypothetical protein PLF13_00050 [candidate division Zixibacteria bacterium]|nr:hypothetical protein [candidate division Zixibacteria bacterium]